MSSSHRAQVLSHAQRWFYRFALTHDPWTMTPGTWPLTSWFFFASHFPLHTNSRLPSVLTPPFMAGVSRNPPGLCHPGPVNMASSHRAQVLSRARGWLLSVCDDPCSLTPDLLASYFTLSTAGCRMPTVHSRIKPAISGPGRPGRYA